MQMAGARFRGVQNILFLDEINPGPGMRRARAKPRTIADSIQGDSLQKADLALEVLLNNPKRLQRKREQFSDSPPSYRSQFSGPMTRSKAPTVPTRRNNGDMSGNFG
ncbi:hypothetical protein N656DRAFT_849794 [Canariomyces notabilis]|uniref:Uncharacterized protein n=1 Tax=Canariomyces notabilis TaxID=2074819 RepID=A0AAN6QF08_9PEZI|nr:hypothetical protein N656DRAFT_849794 [Canariomyces arenarius]